MLYSIKKNITRTKRILQNPKDFKFLYANKNLLLNGVLIVIHESQELGASLLALHTAEELIKQGNNVYIVSRQFGKLNAKFNEIAPTQIALTLKQYRKICRKLSINGYRRALLITAGSGDLTKITKECGFKVVSMIHELGQVIKMLHLEKATAEMLRYSDKILFSTTIAKKQILEVCNAEDNSKIFVRPQGVYFNKPSMDDLKTQQELLLTTYPSLKDKTIIAGVGNTTERKGFDLFLQTAKLMPEYYFIWAGKKENYYDEAVSKNGQPSNFLYLGSMTPLQLSAVYSLANVYLMCSRFDTLPSTIFEALLLGTPVIGARNSGGIVDVINSENGCLTDNADCIQFRNSIETLLNKELKVKIKGNSFNEYIEYVLQLFFEGEC